MEPRFLRLLVLLRDGIRKPLEKFFHRSVQIVDHDYLYRPLLKNKATIAAVTAAITTKTIHIKRFSAGGA
jgi:hypothetical protein